MAYAQSGDVRLFYEDTGPGADAGSGSGSGKGPAIVFVHEYLADHRHWETQVRYFSRFFRCITFNARGYPPSDVPPDDAAYGYEHYPDDIKAVLDHLGLDQAYIVGLSMGAYAALLFGLRYATRALGLVLAGCGSGALPADHAAFKREAAAMADHIAAQGMATLARSMAQGATRVQLQNKDPRGFEEFVGYLADHSTEGSARTMRTYQGGRPSLYDFDAKLAKLDVPVLLALGDEDEACLDVNLHLKRRLPMAGLWIAPRTGHGINLEEPAAFNAAVQDFLFAVQLGRWTRRDPRSRAPGLLSIGAKA